MRQIQEQSNIAFGTRTDNTRKWICMAAAALIAGILTGALVERRTFQVEAKISDTQLKLAEEVLRFHVLANSDSEEDQALKMKVKEEIISYMKKEIPDADSVEETKKWVSTHQKELENTARNVIKSEGYNYAVTARLTRSYFPDKTYGDVTFPAGDYEALRIEIGEAEGQNWWCVLYPNLCFIDSVNVVVPEEGKQELQTVLEEDEYEMVTAASKFKIKWFFFGKD